MLFFHFWPAIMYFAIVRRFGEERHETSAYDKTRSRQLFLNCKGTVTRAFFPGRSRAVGKRVEINARAAMKLITRTWKKR